MMTEKLLAFSVPGSKDIVLPGQIQNIANGVKGSPFGSNIILWGIYMAYFLAIFTALAYFIYAGIRWIMSGGDAKNIESARTQVIYAAIGLGAVLLSVFFINAISTVACVPLLGFSSPNCH